MVLGIEASTGLPTADQQRLTRQAHDQLKTVIERLNRVLAETVPAFNRALDGAGVSWTPGRPLPLPSDAWLRDRPVPPR